MAGFAPGVGTGIKQMWVRVETSPGHAKWPGLRGDLAENPKEVVVPYSWNSGNMVFELPIHTLEQDLVAVSNDNK